MRPVDCPGESRMRENLMSGLGKGEQETGLATAPAPHFTMVNESAIRTANPPVET